MATDTDNLFQESSMNNSKVKFGAPHVVDFGKDFEHSSDKKVYIIGHGATRPEAHQSWMQVSTCTVTALWLLVLVKRSYTAVIAGR